MKQSKPYTKQRKLRLLSFFLVCLLSASCLLYFRSVAIPSKEYGVFLGIGTEETKRVEPYRIIVIEPSEFPAETIREWQTSGKSVYGYLNIGAIEEYRPYYSRFKDLRLSRYEDWPDEHWIDVSDPKWRNFLVDELGKTYADKGLDGFFLDNTDVYSHYQTDATFQGLSEILKGLKKYEIPLIVNGGSDFVFRQLEEAENAKAEILMDGINQETVFTSIDFKNKSYGAQQEAETRYLMDYLEKAKMSGLSVYLLEYGAEPELSQKIEAYCKENGFLWYNAEGLELK